MNSAKMVGGAALVAGGLTNQDWILILSIVITVLGMIQDYLKDRRTS